MTVFWLVVAAGLMFYGRFGTDNFKSENLGQVVFNASQVAMLGCIGLAFFSLFDQPSPSSTYSGPGSNFWPTVGGLVAAAVALWVIGAVLVRSFRRRRLSRDELTTPELTLTLDRTAGIVRITQPGRLAADRVAMGHLVVDVAPYESDSQKRAALTLSQWPESSRMSPETARKGLAEVVRVDVWSDTARDVVAWLRLHPGVELDAARVKQSWQARVDHMVRFVRSQRLVEGKPAVEAWVPVDGPSLDYVVIESDGRVFAGVGEEPLLERVTAPLRSDGNRRIRVEVGEFRPSFILGTDQVAVVQKLHARGLLHLEKEAL